MKKTLLYNLILILSIGMIHTSYGQEGTTKKAEKRFGNYAYVDARNLYERVAKNGFTSPEVLKHLGDSYYFTSEYRNAVQWYGKLIATDSIEVAPEYYFRYAQALKSVERYEEADQMMDLFENANTNDSRGKMYTKERDYLAEIEKQSGRFSIKTTHFNSELQDFSPSFYGDRLVFSSNREDRTGGLIHDWNEQPFLDLYIVDDPEGDTNTVHKLEGDVNTKYHESSSAFNSNGDIMYFTRNNYASKKLKRDNAGTSKLKLYRSFRENGKWATAEELPFNSDEYSVAHPALSPDGETLYFASDMPGTVGLSDIWKVAINTDGSFGTPENLGTTINTEGRETFPFISSEGQLFFATDGHIGLGGLDVFVTQIEEDDTIGDVYNVGRPVNSSADDFGLILHAEKGVGYFSSSRATGIGNDDIYTIQRLEKLIVACKQSIVGVTKNTKTNAIIPNAQVVVRDTNGAILAETVSDRNGAYQFENQNCNTLVSVRAQKEGYEPAEVTIQTDGELDRVIERDLYLEPKAVISVGSDLTKVLNLNPIYFDLDKSFIRPDAAAELEKVVAVMQQNPNLKIDVRSHTDSRGRDGYNLSLSQRRNLSTKEYIISRGISSSRITGNGYGETQLINQCSNGVQCSEEEHQLNRRSEFIVVAN